MRSRLLAFTIVLLSLGCGSASNSRPATIARPDIDVRLDHSIFFSSDTQPVNIEVTIQNPATQPVTVRRIEISSVAMTQWSVDRVSQTFAQTIAPGQTRKFTVFATARTTTDRPQEPLTLRTVVEFEGAGTHWREVTTQGF